MTFPLQMAAPDGTVLAQAYIHQMLNYRYHWHRQEYELFLLLQGKAVFNRGEEVWALELLAHPNLGRSYCDPHDKEISALLQHWLAAPEG